MYSVILNQYETVSLEDLNERASLQNRIDKKFVLPFATLTKILQECKNEYYVLKVDGNCIFDYTNLYYDTPGLKYYHQHHSGRANRYKIRARSYKNNGSQYIEVKQKKSNGKTVKHRFVAENIEDASGFLNQFSDLKANELIHTLKNKFKRITLLHKHKIEKITIDLNLNFESDANFVNYDNILIVEVKTESRRDIDFCKMMKSYSVREGALSKYCLGLISLNNNIKHNNFKYLFLKTKKQNLNGIF